jgi:hypothetical protein
VATVATEPTEPTVAIGQSETVANVVGLGHPTALAVAVVHPPPDRTARPPREMPTHT